MDVAGALSLEGIAANPTMLHPAIGRGPALPGAPSHARPARRAARAGARSGSPASPRNLQDPLTFRNLPQVQGACRDVLDHVDGAARDRAERVAGQPDRRRPPRNGSISVANFEILPLAAALDYLRIVLATALTSSAERTREAARRAVVRPADRADARAGGTAEAGLTYLSLAAQSLAVEARLLAQPVSFELVSTAHAEGIEDRTTMAPLAARRVAEMVELGERIVAIELAVGAQAAELRGLRRGRGDGGGGRGRPRASCRSSTPGIPCRTSSRSSRWSATGSSARAASPARLGPAAGAGRDDRCSSTARDRPPEEAGEDTSFARGLRILLTVADRGEVRAEELALLLDTPTSTVYRYLRTLTAFGFVDRRDGRYLLGPRLVIGSGTNVTSEQLIRIADPVLRYLVAETGETAVITRRIGLSAVCLHRVESEQPLRGHARSPGSMSPLHAGATGRVLLAYALPEIIDEVLARGLEQRDAATRRTRRSCERRSRRPGRPGSPGAKASWFPVPWELRLPFSATAGSSAPSASSVPKARCGLAWRARVKHVCSRRPPGRSRPASKTRHYT